MHFVYTEPVFFKDVENYVKVKLKSLHLRRYNSQFRIIKTSFHTFHRVFNTEKFVYAGGGNLCMIILRN